MNILIAITIGGTHYMKGEKQSKKCCDTCKHYHWYYDKCDKYDCEVDARSICAEYEPYHKGGK